VRVGTRLTIIENRAHSTERRRSTVAHEMSHVLLEHDFSMLITSEHTWTARDGSVEGEANWLAAELLLPQKAAQRAAMRGTAPHLVASAYGVSIEIATWRMNISGGQTIARRAATKWLRS